jgi:imidazolonepropionase-like amidohydrolase
MKLVIKCGALFDAAGSDVARGKSVVIDGGVIQEIVDTVQAERDPSLAEARIIDASSQWVMPGLINVHDHMIFRDLVGSPMTTMASRPSKLALNAVRNCIVALRRGWTTVRDMGASHNFSFEFREYLGAGDLPGPRIIACGAPICVTGGHANSICIEADGAAEVRKAARSQLQAGADFIKVMASHDPIEIRGPEKTRPEMELDEIRAAYDQAHAHGKQTACHVMGTVAIGRVLDAGVDVISHGYYLNDELASRMVEQNVYYDPTLSSYGRQTINPKLQRGEAWAEHHKPLIPAMESAFRAAVKAGVKIVTGTDSAGRYAEDVVMMRELGLEPSQSLLACTRYAAEALGVEEAVGTVEAGKIADLVVLDGDPLKDAYALEKVALVVQGGRPIRPEEIGLESLV